MTKFAPRRASARRLAGAALAASIAGVAFAAPASAATTTVRPGSLSPFEQVTFNCTDPAASPASNQSFVTGPATPPAGTGSLQFDYTSTPDEIDEYVFTSKYDGTELGDIESLAYSTYVSSADQVPLFAVEVDNDADPDVDATVMYDPSDNGMVAPGAWQTWSVRDGAGYILETGTDIDISDYFAANATAVVVDIYINYPCDTPAGGTKANVDRIVVDLAGVEADLFDFEAAAATTTTPTPTTSGPPTGANGYRMVAGDGGIFTFGNRQFWGSTGNMTLNKPIVGGATDISDYEGYWIVASDGGVFTFNATFHGSLGDKVLTSPAVEIEPTPTGDGYWIVQADGTVTAFGGATHVGDFRGRALNKPIIGMSVTPSGEGYWLVAQDGGIFNFGDAEFFGSMGNTPLNKPIIDLAPAVDNKGYYLLGADGGVFTFGSADFKGSTGAMTLNAPVVAMLVNPAGSGYWLAASDGGVFTFGPGAAFLGSMGDTKLNSPVLDLIN